MYIHVNICIWYLYHFLKISISSPITLQFQHAAVVICYDY